MDSDIRLQNLIKTASLRIRDKLVQVSLSSLGISAYNQKYLQEHFKNIDYTLDMYGTVLFQALNKFRIPLDKFVIVDYGGGSGIFSLLAKETGIGTIVYTDIYDVSCKDMKTLSQHLKFEINHIVCGDIAELKEYLQNMNISVNALVSFNVIEHIYNIENHFQELSDLQKLPLRIVYGSGANIENFWKVRSIVKMQKMDEFEIKESTWGHKERDSLLPFIELRRDIISKYAPELDPSKVDFLAKSTRGLIKSDIEHCINEFLQTGNITYQIKHPTNTCDPLTGNWTEHLIDLEQFKQFLEQIGFKVRIIPGKYYPYGSLVKKGITLFLNLVIRLLKRKGMIVSPYYLIIAQSEPRQF
jgi:SAM-dependent methyltransferase